MNVGQVSRDRDDDDRTKALIPDFCHWIIPLLFCVCIVIWSVGPLTSKEVPWKDKLGAWESILKITGLAFAGTWAIKQFVLARPDRWSLNIATVAEVADLPLNHPMSTTHALMIVKVSVANASGVSIDLNSFDSTVRVLEIGLDGQFVNDQGATESLMVTTNGHEAVMTSIDHMDDQGYRIETKTNYWDEFAMIVPRNRLIEVTTIATCKDEPNRDYIGSRAFTRVGALGETKTTQTKPAATSHQG